MAHGLTTPITTTNSGTIETALVKNADGSAVSAPTYVDCTANGTASNGQKKWVCAVDAPGGTYPAGAQKFRVKGSADPSDAALSVTAGVVVPGTTPAPTLTSLNPPTGAVGTSVTLTGTNLTGATLITFVGTSNNTVSTGYTVNSAGTQITGIVVPSGAQTGAPSVTTPAGTAVSPSAFTVTTSGLPITYLLGVAGQSNAQTKAPRSEIFPGGTLGGVTPSFTREFQRVRIYNPATNAFEKLQVGSVNYSFTGVGIPGNDQGQQAPENFAPYEDGIGYAVAFAWAFEQQNTTDELLIVTRCQGNTQVARFQDGDPNTGGLLFNGLKAEYDGGKTYIAAQNRQVNELGIVFVQGEADIANANYKTDLDTLAASYRSKIIPATARIQMHEVKGEAATIARQHAWAAGDINGGVSNSDNVKRLDDYLHVDTTSFVQIVCEQDYPAFFGTAVAAPAPADTLPGGYGWLNYQKSYLPAATVSRWKNYAGRRSDFDLVQPDPNSQFQLVVDADGILCYRSNGTTSVFTSLKPEDGHAFTFIVAVNLVNDGRWQGIAEANVFLMAGGASNGDIFDGKQFLSKGQYGNHLQDAVGKKCIITYVFGVGTDNSFIRLNGNEVWRGTTSVDGLGQLAVGKTGGAYANGDFYAFLVAQHEKPIAEIVAEENKIASEINVTFVPTPIPTGAGLYANSEGIVVPDEWSENVNANAGFQGGSALYTATDKKLYGKVILTDATSDLTFYGNDNSASTGDMILSIPGQPDVTLVQPRGLGSLPKAPTVRVSQTGLINYTLRRAPGNTDAISLDALKVVKV